MRPVVALVVAAALMAGTAAAQPAPWQPERLTPGWTFMPSLVLGVLWDNNVTVQGQGTPEISEWVGVLNPRGEIVYNGRQSRFNAGYSGAIERYRNLSALDNYEQRGRLQFRQTVTRQLAINAAAGLSYSPTTDRVEAGVIPFVDIGSRVIDAGGGATYRLSRRTSIEGAYGFRQVEFDRQESANLPAYLTGGVAHSPSVHVRHDISSRLAIGAGYTYRLAEVAGGTSMFNVQDASGDVRYRLSESTVVNGAAGASYLHVADTDVTVWGPSLRAGIERQIGTQSLYARYERAFVPSFSFGGLTGNQFLTVGVNAPLTRGGRLVLGGSTSYSRTDPVEELGFTFQLDTVWLNGTLGYQLSRWLRVEGFVTSTHQTSTAQGNVDRTRVGLQFSTSKPVRIQ